MPKQRAPFDHGRYRELKAQGLSQREIAKAMQIPESTLRDNLKAQQQHGEGPPMETEGPPMNTQGIPMDTQSPPVEQATAVSEGRATVQGDFSPPPAMVLEVDTRTRYVDPPDLSDDLKEMLGWWRTRQSARRPRNRERLRSFHRVKFPSGDRLRFL